MLLHLSLQPVHQRGWGSTDAALAHGRVDTEALGDLLARHRLQDGQSIYAVDISTWPRCDARYDLKLWISALRESATYPPA